MVQSYTSDNIKLFVVVTAKFHGSWCHQQILPKSPWAVNKIIIPNETSQSRGTNQAMLHNMH